MHIISKWYRNQETKFIYGETQFDSNGINVELLERIKEIKWNSINYHKVSIDIGFQEWRQYIQTEFRKPQQEKVTDRPKLDNWIVKKFLQII